MLKIKLIVMVILIFTFSALYGWWESDQRLTIDPAESFTHYDGARNTWCIATNGNTVHVVWCDDRDDPVWQYQEIYYKRSTDSGVTWGPDTRLSFSPYVVKSELPSIAASGSKVHVTWSQYVGNWAHDIFYRRSLDGGITWQDTVRLTYSPDSLWRYIATEPTVAVLGPYVYVVYSRGDAPLREGNVRTVCYRRSTNYGLSWQPEVSLTNGIDYAGQPTVALAYGVMSPDSSLLRGPSLDKVKILPFHVAHIVWTDGRDGNYTELYYQRITNSQIFPCVRLTYTDCASWYPSIAVSGSRVHVIWQENTHTVGNKVFYKRSLNCGQTWGPNIPLIDTTGYSNAMNPSLAISGSKLHVVWENFDNGSWLFYKRSTSNGSSWQPETCLTANGYYWSRFASIAVSGLNVHMVWTDYRDGNLEIYYKRDPTGGFNFFSGPLQGKGRTSHSAHTSPIPMVNPNPFIAFARVLGHEQENFMVYDISGKLVGSYRGDRIGADLPPGVYFLKGSIPHSEPLRIVKVQ